MELPRIGIGTAGFCGIYNEITPQECGNIVDKASQINSIILIHRHFMEMVVLKKYWEIV